MDQLPHIPRFNEPESRPIRALHLKVFLLLIGIVGPFTSNAYLPSLPTMTVVFNTSHNMVQLTIAFYLLGFSLFQLVYGPCSDRFGRRPVLLVGQAIALVASLGCASAQSIDTLILFRIMQGAGIASCTVIMRSIMRDVFSGMQLARAASQISIAFAIAPAVAPVLGGYIESWLGWRMNFAAIMIYITSIGIGTWLYLPETNRFLNRNATKVNIMLSNYKLLLKHKVFLGYLFCSGLAIAGIIAYTTASPFLFQTLLGMSAVSYGWLTLFIALALIISRIVNAILVTRVGLTKMIYSGTLLMTFSGFLMLGIALFGIVNVPVILIPAMLFVTGGGFIIPNAMAGAFTPFPKIVGSVAALYGCLQIMISFLTSTVVAASHERDQAGLAIVFCVLGILAFLSLRYLILGQAAKSPK